MNNERFFGYYKAQRLFVSGREKWGKNEEEGMDDISEERGEKEEEEWKEFVESLRRHLPTTFRVAGSRE